MIYYKDIIVKRHLTAAGMLFTIPPPGSAKNASGQDGPHSPFLLRPLVLVPSIAGVAALMVWVLLLFPEAYLSRFSPGPRHTEDEAFQSAASGNAPGIPGEEPGEEGKKAARLAVANNATNATREELPESVDPAWAPLIKRLEAEGFAREDIVSLFSRLGTQSYTPAFMAAKITELYGVGGIGIKHDLNYPLLPEGYEQPLSDITVGEYKAFKVKYAEDLESILETHGVPANVIVALLLVETGLGSDLGKGTAFRSLACMAATDTADILGSMGNKSQAARVNALKLRETLKGKSDWAFKELVALIDYGQDNDRSIADIPGSMFGAIGICQFMPSNIALYGVDGDNNGIVDLFSVVDAMYSAANYLEAHGWRNAGTDDKKLAVLQAYNQDSIYAMRVLSISKQLALADKGKLADHRNPMYAPGAMPLRSLDPSLKRLRRPPSSARVQSLGNYEEMLTQE